MILFPKYPQGRRNVIRDEGKGPRQVFPIIKSKTCFFKRPFSITESPNKIIDIPVALIHNDLLWNSVCEIFSSHIIACENSRTII